MKTLSLLISLAAIIISSFTLIGLLPSSTTDGALSIISICVTLIVGISVVDSLTIHNVQKQIERITESQKELEKQKEKFQAIEEEQTTMLFISNQISWGLATLNWQPLTSLNYFVKGLEKSIETNHGKGMNNCLKCMEQVPKAIKQQGITDFHDSARKGNIPQISEEIRRSELFKLIEKRVEMVFDEVKPYYKQENVSQ